MKNQVSRPLMKPVSIFQGTTEPIYSNVYTLETLLIRPPREIIEAYERGKEAWTKAGERKERRYNHLLSYTPAGFFKYRSNNHIDSFTSLCCLDFDAKDNLQNKDWNNLLTDVFPKIDYIAYAAKSFSGTGYYCLVPIEQDVLRYTDNAKALIECFKAGGLIADHSCTDICRLRFFVPPVNFYYNETPVRFTAPPAPLVNQSEIATTAYKVVHSMNTNTYRYNPTKCRLERLIDLIEDRRVDITSNYWDWVKIAFALNNEFGEAGRLYFHRISQFHSRYNKEDADKKYSDCKNSKNVSSSSIFYLAKQHGLTLNSYR